MRSVPPSVSKQGPAGVKGYGAYDQEPGVECWGAVLGGDSMNMVDECLREMWRAGGHEHRQSHGLT